MDYQDYPELTIEEYRRYEQFERREQQAKTSQVRAKIFADMLLTCYHGQLPEFVLGERTADNLFEMNDGDIVVRQFLKLYHKNVELQRATESADRYVGIQRWQEKYEQLSLF